MPTYSFGMLSTTAISLVMYLLGTIICKKVKFLKKYYIPAPVVGGLLFAVVNFILNFTGVIEFTFDKTIQTIAMTLFFTSVGYMASIKLLKKGGLSIVFMVIVAAVLIALQNLVGVGISSALGLDGKLGLLVGSIPFSGGNGTASAWGSVYAEQYGIAYADALGNAAATVGLVMAGLVGGPVAKRLFNKKLKGVAGNKSAFVNEEKDENSLHFAKVLSTVILLFICMGVSEILYPYFTKLLHLISPNLNLPSYILSMIIAMIVRNVQELVFKKEIPSNENDKVGDIGLQIFLSIALTTLDLVSLTKVDKSVGLLLILAIVSQLVLVVLYTSIVTFRVMGKNYDAVVMGAGHCGFALGATPTAIANMDAFCKINGKSEKAYLTVPLVGAMFIDFVNALIISVFIGFLA
jgi:ESS family glutamate:Na+ symporter